MQQTHPRLLGTWDIHLERAIGPPLREEGNSIKLRRSLPRALQLVHKLHPSRRLNRLKKALQVLWLPPSTSSSLVRTPPLK